MNTTFDGITVTVAPTVEPVVWADIKAQSRIDDDDDQSLVESYITAARVWAEAFTGRAFISQTIRVTLDHFPDGQIILPRAPVSSVTSITYTDVANSSQTWSSASYQVDLEHLPPRIAPIYGQAYPTTLPDSYQAVKVTYVAGYGAAATSVPDGIKQAIRLLAAHWYEAREPVVTGTIVTKVPFTVEALLWSFRVPELP